MSDQVKEIVERLKELVHEGNVRRILVKKDDEVIVNVPLTAGIVGGLLGICPLLHVNNQGQLEPVAKIPSRKLVRREMLKKMEQQAENGLEYSGKCYICQSDIMEDARKVADEIESRFPHLNGKVQIYPIGGVIGCHTGPGTVALFFWGDERVD